MLSVKVELRTADDGKVTSGLKFYDTCGENGEGMKPLSIGARGKRQENTVLPSCYERAALSENLQRQLVPTLAAVNFSSNGKY